MASLAHPREISTSRGGVANVAMSPRLHHRPNFEGGNPQPVGPVGLEPTTHGLKERLVDMRLCISMTVSVIGIEFGYLSTTEQNRG
jgi:hypothetical protein